MVAQISRDTQRQKAERFRELHHRDGPLVLVNAWDAVSARIVENLGFPAVATTSAGVAWAEGFADGENISRERMLSRVAIIAQAVTVPITADLESGYGPSVEDAVATARGALEAGAVGLNFEDHRGNEGSLVDVDLQVKRIQAIRKVGADLGVPIVINARTDVYLARIGDSDAWRLQEAVTRGNEYLRAGADCVFVPGTIEEATIKELVAKISGPINILASAMAPSIARLRQLGVARISLGSGAHGYVLGRFQEIAAKLREDGDFQFLNQRISHADVNSLVTNAEPS